MAPEEVGFDEVKGLVRRSWKWALGLAAVFGVAALVVVSTVIPPVYTATARLVIYPLAAGEESTGRPVQISLLESEGILVRTADKLIADGILPEGSTLVLGKDLSRRIVDSGPNEDGGSVLLVTARSHDPNDAAAIANTWAQMLVEESQTLPRSRAGETEKLLAEQLSLTRGQVGELADQTSTALLEFENREEETTKRWDRQIAAAAAKAESAVGEYQSETRRLMEKSAARYASGTNEGGTKILEIVSVRSELAKTPRVVTLRKAVSDEDLAGIIFSGQEVGDLDDRLISQEVNLLYDQLSIRVLELESELQRAAGEKFAEVSEALSELEKIQRERSTGLTALMEENSLEIQSLRRQRSYALKALAREKSTAIAEYERQVKQVSDMESRLANRFNAALFSGLLEQVDLVSLVSPAVPRQVPLPRHRAIKVAAAIFLGGILGLAIGLFLTPREPEP